MLQMEQSAVSLDDVCELYKSVQYCSEAVHRGCSADLAISVFTATIHHLQPIMTKLCIDTRAKKSNLAVLLE